MISGIPETPTINVLISKVIPMSTVVFVLDVTTPNMKAFTQANMELSKN